MKPNVGAPRSLSPLFALLLTACAPAPSPTLAGDAKPAGTPAPVERPAPAAPRFTYPATRTSPTIDTLHGVAVSDPYRWLEDVKEPEVAKWMDAQDGHARSRFSALPLTEPLRKRFTELFYVDFESAPFRANSRWFWTAQKGTQEKAVVYWREGEKGQARVLLDPNGWSRDGSVSLGSWFVSRNGKTIAYQVKANAADEATLDLVDVASGKKLASIPGAKYSWDIAWSKNDEGIFYTWVPPVGTVPTADRPGQAEIRFHRIGTDPARDPTVRAKTGDPKTFTHAYSGTQDRYAFHVVRHGWVSRDVFTLDLHDPKASWQPFTVGVKANAFPTFHGGRFYVRTDEDAPRGRIFVVDPKKRERGAWKELVPEHATRTLESMRVIGDKLVLSYLDDVKSHIEVRDTEGQLERTVELPGIGSAWLSGHPEDDAAFLTYTTFTQPTQIFRTSVKNGGRALHSEVKVPFDASPYVVEQIFATSKDGTKVPAFVVRHRDAARDGRAPMLMYGYGGYGYATTPAYWGSIVPWLERGGSAAFAIIRGGGEYGESWHQAGMRHKKQNVIDDFHAIAEKLVKDGYTRSDRFAIRGASNGGLLVSAAMTQRPDLYRTVLCGVPLADMVRYHLVGAGKTWIEEFGSSEIEADFGPLYALSPYHHVKEGVRYPSIVITTADTDDRVDPMHARKLAAIFQARSTGGEALLRIEKNAGHGGAGTIKSAVDERAETFAFLMHEVGMDDAPLR
jgi:prolyl oligopeptidase